MKRNKSINLTNKKDVVAEVIEENTQLKTYLHNALVALREETGIINDDVFKRFCLKEIYISSKLYDELMENKYK